MPHFPPPAKRAPSVTLHQCRRCRRWLPRDQTVMRADPRECRHDRDTCPKDVRYCLGCDPGDGS